MSGGAFSAVCFQIGQLQGAGCSGGGQYAVRYAGHEQRCPEVRSSRGIALDG
jgi:hypothetical protein